MNGKCTHLEFRALVKVNRLEDTGQFQADITINCLHCDKPFEFLGLPIGLNLMGAAMSVDGFEARLAISPEGERPTLPPGTVTGFGVKIDV